MADILMDLYCENVPFHQGHAHQGMAAACNNILAMVDIYSYTITLSTISTLSTLSILSVLSTKCCVGVEPGLDTADRAGTQLCCLQHSDNNNLYFSTGGQC